MPDQTFSKQMRLRSRSDFRRVYATMIKEWLGYEDVGSVLKGDFEPLRAFV